MQYELQSRPVPDPGSGAIVAVEACGVSGTDLAIYTGRSKPALPIVPGHEVVGRIAAIGPEASRRWQVAPGDRVLVGSSLACGRCQPCLRGGLCVEPAPGRPATYGYRDPEEWPGLWGGFATHMYLPSHASIRPIRTDVPVGEASLFNVLGNAWHWIVEVGEVRSHDAVLILGPGPRGLACAALAAAAGVTRLAVLGLPHSKTRLAAAQKVGATHVVAAPPEECVEAIRDSGFGLPSLVVDATSGGDVLDAVVPLVPAGARLVLGGLRMGRPVQLSGPSLDRVVVAELTIRGARSSPRSAMEMAAQLIEGGSLPLGAIATDRVGLTGIGPALAEWETLEDKPVHLRVEPSAGT